MNFRPPNLTQTDPSCTAAQWQWRRQRGAGQFALWNYRGHVPESSVNYTGIGMGSLGDRALRQVPTTPTLASLTSPAPPVYSLVLNSTLDIFGFDGDGISTYVQ